MAVTCSGTPKARMLLDIIQDDFNGAKQFVKVGFYKLNGNRAKPCSQTLLPIRI